MKGVYFFLVTLAFGEVVRGIFAYFEVPFGGWYGIRDIPRDEAPEIPPQAAFFEPLGHHFVGLRHGPSEDQIGQRKWAAIKKQIVTIDPALSARDDREEARVGNQDHRFNHWTGVRDGLMSTHADIFPQVAAIAKVLPDPIDQMKLFELMQIIPTPTRAALNSGNLLNARISDPTIMGYLRNNSIFAFGQADRARTSANYREILDAMWLFNAKFERALAIFDEIRKRQKG